MSDEIFSVDMSKPDDSDINPCRVVGRLTTSYWNGANGIHSRRSFRYLKRKSQGHNFVTEDASNVGADETWKRIINMDECKDGVYEVVTCNESRDWETGYIDDYDFKLVPFEEKPIDSEAKSD